MCSGRKTFILSPFSFIKYCAEKKNKNIIRAHANRIQKYRAKKVKAITIVIRLWHRQFYFYIQITLLFFYARQTNKKSIQPFFCQITIMLVPNFVKHRQNSEVVGNYSLAFLMCVILCVSMFVINSLITVKRESRVCQATFTFCAPEHVMWTLT